MPRAKKKNNTPRAGAWEDPPSVERPDWAEVAATLREHPMRWLKVYEHGRASWSTTVAIGHVSALRADLGFEVQTTDNTRDAPRTNTLFMRFNPDRVDSLAEMVDTTKRKAR